MPKSTDIPASVRKLVYERDQGMCRVCGRWSEPAAVHHIVFRSQERNNHSPDNLVLLGGGYDHICHQMVHAHAAVFTPALEAIVNTPGITALAWLRQHGVDIRGLLSGSL